MNKKLSAKLQILAPNLGENETQLSNCITIEPTERQQVLQKGSVYAVFDLYSKTPQNTSLISKLAYDVLSELYYQSDNISPIQSLEKAISALNDKLINLQPQDGTEEKSESLFNIVAAVLWGNVLYMVQFGSGKSFLMREGDIKEVSATSEGKYAVASGVVKSDDVVVLCTETFAKKYPPEKLLGSAIAPNELGGTHSGMILKFIVDTEFTEDEVVDFNVKKEKKSSKITSLLENIKAKKQTKKTESQAIQTLADVSPNIRVKKSLKQGGGAKKLIPIVLGLLVVSLIVNVLFKINKNTPEEPSSTDQQQALETPPEIQQPSQTPEDVLAEGTNAEFLSDEAFYDIKLADPLANPSEVVAFNNTVVATDSVSGKIYTSGIDTPQFEALEDTFTGISNATNYDGKLNFSDSQGYNIYNLSTSAVDTAYPQAGLGLNSTYLGNIYEIKGDTLTKYVPSGTTLESSVWGQSADFDGAKVLDIAYSIYVVSKNNEVFVFTQGEKTDFAVSGLPLGFSNITDIDVNIDFDNIYVADAGNNRIVVLDSTGKYIKEYLPQNKADWDNIKSISVSPDELRLFLLNGSTVFDINLAEE